MKRKNWSPENPNGELRDEDEWERISWDEAFTLCAEEIKKIYNDYGRQLLLIISEQRIMFPNSPSYLGHASLLVLYCICFIKIMSNRFLFNRLPDCLCQFFITAAAPNQLLQIPACPELETCF